MKRIQRKRTKGWRMPDNAVYVGRPTKWGNPWTVKEARESELFKLGCCAKVVVMEYEAWLTKSTSEYFEHLGKWKALKEQRDWILDHIDELRGKDLACWCNLASPCHADVLIKLCEAIL